MPATFPSHAAAVVPLWLRWRAAGLLWWCLPVWLAATVLGRSSLIRVAAHLPGLGVLKLRDHGVLGVVRPPWPVTLTSVPLGAVGHVVSDSFAHGNMPMVGLITPLQRTGPLGEPWWQWLHWTSTVVGAVAVAVITPGVVAIATLGGGTPRRGTTPPGPRR